MEVSRRGTRGMDAERGTKGQGRPFVTAPGAAPEGGNPGAAGAGCRVAFFLVPFSWPSKKKGLAQQGETRSISTPDNRFDEVPDQTEQQHHPNLPVRYQSLLPPRKRDKPLLTPQIANGLSAFLVERLIHIQRWPRMPWLADLACRIPDHRGM